MSFLRNSIEKALKNVQLKFHKNRSILHSVISIFRSARQSRGQCSIIHRKSQREEKSEENAKLEKSEKNEELKEAEGLLY